MTEEQIKELQAWQDEDFGLFMHRLAQTHDQNGYKKGSFLSLMWLLWRIHSKAKKYDMGTLMQIKLGKEL
jgi:hypothetical protein